MPPTSMTIETYSGKDSHRKITLEIGKEYSVSPLNSAMTGHKEQRCILLAFIGIDEGKPDLFAQVKFLDTNRVGRVELDDLA